MVIVTPDTPRKKLFATRTPSQLVRSTGARRATVRSLTEYDAQAERRRMLPAVSGARADVQSQPATSFSVLELGEYDYADERAAIARTMLAAPRDTVVVLPPESRRPMDEARRNLSHRQSTIINLYAPRVLTEALGEVPASKTRLMEHSLTPEAAFRIACAADTLEDCVGYRFHDQVVTWSQAIMGAELRALTNALGYFAGIDRITRELRTGRHARRTVSGKPRRLSAAARAAKERQLSRYERAVEQRGYTGLDRAFGITEDDLITITSTPTLMRGAGRRPPFVSVWNGLVPSRSFDGTRYTVSIAGAAVAHPAHYDLARFYVTDITCRTPVEHAVWAGRTRGPLPHNHWVAPAIAFAHTYTHNVNAAMSWDVWMHDESRDRNVLHTAYPLRAPSLPFIIPRPALQGAVENLRNALIPEYVMRAGKWRMRTLNQGEMDVVLGDILCQGDVEKLVTMDPGRLRDAGEDPQQYLFQYVQRP